MILKILDCWHYFVHKLRIKQLKKQIGFWGGSNVMILPDFKIGHAENLKIHNYVRIGTGAFLDANGGIEIHSGFVSGPNLTIHSSNHIYEHARTIPFDNELVKKPVIIDKNCWFGANVFIVPGVHIGEGCIVAGGAVVTKSFPPLSVIGGNPAKVIKMRDPEDYNNLVGGGKYADWLLQ